MIGEIGGYQALPGHGGAELAVPPAAALTRVLDVQRRSRLMARAATVGAVLYQPDAAIRRGRSQQQIEQTRQTVLDSLPASIIAFFAGVVFALVLLSMSSFVLAVRLAYATQHYGDLPCDQNLRRYIIAVIVVGIFFPQISSRFPRASSATGKFIMSVLTSLPGLCTLCWGINMVSQCETCQQTNPSLFYAAKQFILVQVLLVVVSILVATTSRVMIIAFLASFVDREGPGCETLVHEHLAKVPNDCTELREDDGTTMDCPICCGSMDRGAVVRTDCSHHFHEDCLATWCRNHLTCPSCRTAVGPAEEV